MPSVINSTNIISLKEVSKRYNGKGKMILEDINIDIKKGEFFCLVGPSGGGKSTILKMIAGIDNPTHGVIEKPGTVSMVFQSGALLPWLSVSDNAAFGLKMSGMGEGGAKEKARYYLEMVGLKDYLKKYPRELSGGQRQRVGIARALTLETQVLLLDEPFSALDLFTTKELHQDLLKIWKDTNKTIVMISHSLEEAIFLADRVAVLKNGKISLSVTLELPRPRDEKSSAFLSHLERISGEIG